MKLIDPQYRVLLGSIGWFWSLIYVVLCSVSLITMHTTALASIITASTAMIGAGLLKKK